jgi:hypothetical protein
MELSSVNRHCRTIGRFDPAAGADHALEAAQVVRGAAFRSIPGDGALDVDANLEYIEHLLEGPLTNNYDHPFVFDEAIALE